MENRFQDMFDKRTYNPKKRNSASKLRGCIQHEQLKTILALLTNNSVMEIFKKILITVLVASVPGHLLILNF